MRSPRTSRAASCRSILSSTARLAPCRLEQAKNWCARAIVVRRSGRRGARQRGVEQISRSGQEPQDGGNFAPIFWRMDPKSSATSRDDTRREPLPRHREPASPWADLGIAFASAGYWVTTARRIDRISMRLARSTAAAPSCRSAGYEAPRTTSPVLRTTCGAAPARRAYISKAASASRRVARGAEWRAKIGSPAAGPAW